MMRNCNSNRGFTLIELLISISLGIVAVSAIMFFYLTTVTTSAQTLKKARLNQEVSTALDIMVGEIRRAGISSSYNVEDPAANPFNNTNYMLRVWSVNGGNWVEESFQWGSGSLVKPGQAACITFTYDSELDGVVDDYSDFVGFRLSGNVLQMFDSSSNPAPFTCSSGTWTEIIDSSDIKITYLNFDVTDFSCFNHSEPDGNDSDTFAEKDCFDVKPTSGNLVAEIRKLKLTISAELFDDPDVYIDLTSEVRVRNDRFYYAP